MSVLKLLRRLLPIAAVLAATGEAAAGQAVADNTSPSANPLRATLNVSFQPSERPDEHAGDAGSLTATPRSDVVTWRLQAPVPPTPEHTGWSALWHGTVSDFAAFPKRKSTWVILAVGAAGAAAVHPSDHEINARLVGNETMSRVFAAGKYLGLAWVQAGIGVGTYVIGRYVVPPDPGTKHSNKVAHIGFDLVRAQILTQTLTVGIKLAVQRDRPTGECCAFPSGHASMTFATAAVLERHFGLRNAWPTLLIAGYVAASRLHDNQHWASDVVFGAALGMASGWTVVGRHGRSNYTWMPIRVPGGVGILVVSQPRSNNRGSR